MDITALFHMIQLFRRRADNLENDRDRSFFTVIISNGQRDPFPIFVYA